jgi:pimeloyl-ACP methyl ester carboxylesterase
MLTQIREQLFVTALDGYIGCLEVIRRMSYLDQLGEINIPTLIIVGAEDPGTPMAAAEAMHHRIRNSKLIVLPSARRLSNVEQPKPFHLTMP